MTGLLDPLGLPAEEFQRFFTDLRHREHVQSTRQQHEEDFILGARECAPHILGEHLDAELDAKHAENTVKMYNSDIRRFTKYCREQGVMALPAAPESVFAFLTEEMVGVDRPPPLRSVKRMIASISDWHRRAQLWSPTDDVLVRATVKWVEAIHREKMNPNARLNGNGAKTEH